MAQDATLHVQQRHALAAYVRGHISIGKLAEALGMHVPDLRRWLSEHGIEQNKAADISSACEPDAGSPTRRGTPGPPGPVPR